MRESLDARAFIEALVTEGSANPGAVRDMVADGRRLQAGHRSWYRETARRLEAARAELDAAVDSYIREVEVTMKFGVLLPHFGAEASFARLMEGAVEAEELGYDSVWVRDHLVYWPHDYEDP